ncbi:hypothetical protein A2907_01730 [Candidatus Azambacteria bacterium RIFCSPLOWO2_01_FULL_37_9]|uniref:Uncharacterized protein n=1 Tax=Candidatus Azambacteria bacterium RIFCSPLOWO2_01_FULL_37_9 TaxID=1797297 RepID=A0A1F5C976_9BACT|nr:MAG: hypothetical protein A2907_01730 [Candidatus Azambacteria bacterium RIFCSPLOWO2_01_FULL_37_9]
MFYIFLPIFLIILIIFAVILSILILHLVKYRLPEKDYTNKIIIFFLAGSSVFLLINIIAFFSIPWDSLIY